MCLSVTPGDRGGIPLRIKDISLKQFVLLPLALIPSVSQKENFSCPLIPCYQTSDCSLRKHVLCFYQVIETQVEIWENEKSCGNMRCRQVFPQHFWTTMTRKRKTTCQHWLSKCKFSLLVLLLHKELVLVLRLYWVKKKPIFK